VDLRWAGEPDIVLKLEPTNKWVMNALRLGAPHLRRPACSPLLPRQIIFEERIQRIQTMNGFQHAMFARADKHTPRFHTSA